MGGATEAGGVSRKQFTSGVTVSITAITLPKLPNVRRELFFYRVFQADGDILRAIRRSSEKWGPPGIFPPHVRDFAATGVSINENWRLL